MKNLSFAYHVFLCINFGPCWSIHSNHKNINSPLSILGAAHASCAKDKAQNFFIWSDASLNVRRQFVGHQSGEILIIVCHYAAFKFGLPICWVGARLSCDSKYAQNEGRVH